jgi:tetratricopeptide (TPR) repeat protein
LHNPELVAFTPEVEFMPDVSRDGRFVVFTSNQNGNLDVWVRDYGSGVVYPVTRAPADDSDPRLSERRRLVFASRRADAKGDIYLKGDLGAGGGVKRLTGPDGAERQPVFGGGGIYFVSDRGGEERIEWMQQDGRRRRGVSPGPGFDPDPSPDGRHLIYVEPPPHGDRAVPHLVMLRLADGSTRAVTADDRPEGFPRFDPFVPGRVVYVRFPDDDNRDGEADAADRPSLWELAVDADALFAGRPAAAGRPVPLTDGSAGELFPALGPGGLVYTQGRDQQDILRLPAGGRFPAVPSDVLLAWAPSRSAWFGWRAVAGREPVGSPAWEQALLQSGRWLLDVDRPDLAQRPLARLAAAGGPRAPEARIGLASVDRALGRGGGVEELDQLAASLPATEPVQARWQLERAERLAASGDRIEAAAAFGRLAEHPDREVAARAALRRIDLLGVAPDPDAIGRAYEAVADRFPDQPGVVRRAADRLVDRHLDGIGGDEAQRRAVLERVMALHGPGVIRRVARVARADSFARSGMLDAAALDLEAAMADATGDERVEIAVRLARRLERTRPAAAAQAWKEVLAAGGTAYASEARAALIRSNLERAEQAEQDDDLDLALAAYAEVLRLDETQSRAWRRQLAVAARRGEWEMQRRELEEATRTRRAPALLYALGLARTYGPDPDLGAAAKALTRSIELNPRYAPAYLARGWVREMQELEEPGFFERLGRGFADAFSLAFGTGGNEQLGDQSDLELAIEDYKTALRLNVEASNPQLESEILVNLGNAHYRIGHRTYDLTNVELAFQRYIEALRLGHRPGDGTAGFVFWERLGRAAAWARAWPESVTALRRALSLSAAVGQSERVTQLRALLALVYDQAGQPDFSRPLLAQMQNSLQDEEERARLALALREQVRLEPASPQALDRLQRARQLVADAGVPRGDVPSMWRPVSANTSRAQFGFDQRSELAVNLALAQRIHEELGEHGASQAILQQRLEQNRRITKKIPKRYLFFQSEITTLVTLREQLGLQLLLADRRGDSDGWSAARAQIVGWLDSAERRSDRRSHLADLVRIDALRTLNGASPSELQESLRKLDAVAGRPLDTTDSSTAAWVRTATAAVGSDADQRELDGVRALAHLALAARADHASTSRPRDPEAALLGGLEADVDREVHRARAIGYGRRSGPGLGHRVAGLALLGTQLLPRAEAARAAGALFRDQADLPGWVLARLSAVPDPMPGDRSPDGPVWQALLSVPPGLVPELRPVASQLAQTRIRRALDRRRWMDAVRAIDAWAAYTLAGRGLPVRPSTRWPEDGPLLRDLRSAQRTLLRLQEARVEGDFDPGPSRALVDAIQRQAEDALFASIHGRVRLYGRSLEVSTWGEALTDGRALAVPRWVEPGWLLVRTSTAGRLVAEPWDGSAAPDYELVLPGSDAHWPSARRISAPSVLAALARAELAAPEPAPASGSEPWTDGPPWDAVVLQDRLRTESGAPERSRLGEAGEGQPVDRAHRGRRLDAWRRPAQRVWFERAGGADPFGLDLALAGWSVPRAGLWNDARCGPSPRPPPVGPGALDPPREGCTVWLGLDRDVPVDRRRQLVEAESDARSALRSGAFAEAAEALRRWIQLLKAGGQERSLPAVYGALVGVLAYRLDPPRPAEAAAVQAEVIAMLQQDAEPAAVAAAQAEYASLLGKAGRTEPARMAFETSLAGFESLGAGGERRSAEARVRFAQLLQTQQQLDAAAEQLERVVAAFDGEPLTDPSAVQAILQLGDLYLNRLSDPARAGAVYGAAAERLADADDRRRARLALIRVARRSGAFDDAAARARRLFDDPEAQPLVRLEALIEAANVSWYRGDVRRGEQQCLDSLAFADRLNEEALRRPASVRRRAVAEVRGRRVFALSVCGLLAMSEGRAELAVARLQEALQIARSLGRDQEVATQLNNLGRVHLEFGRLEAAVQAFERARAIDERLDDTYALAYDHRNLGRALLERGDPSSESVLRTALGLAERARDDNNRARTLFALAIAAFRADRVQDARTRVRRAMDLADRLDLAELRWRTRWLLAQLAEGPSRRAALTEALTILEASPRLVGRDLGPSAADVFDALVQLELEQGRDRAAWRVFERGRRYRQQRSSAEDPQPPQLGPDQAMLVMGLTGRRITAFRWRGDELKGVRRRLPEGFDVEQLRARVRSGLPLGARWGELGRWLLNVHGSALVGVRTLALVLDPALDGLPWPALPWGEGTQWVDAFVLLRASDPQRAEAALTAESTRPTELEVWLSARPPGLWTGVPYAAREAVVIAEAWPTATVVEAAAGDGLVAAFERAPSLLHFAGHTRLVGPEPYDPLGGGFVAADGVLPFRRVLAVGRGPAHLVLSSCGGRRVQDAVLGFQAAGVGKVLVASDEVRDDVAAVFMRALYRALRGRSLREALAEARRVVRARAPEPHAWASFVLYE